MFGDRKTPSNSNTMTSDSPQYNILSSDMLVSITFGAILMSITLGLMLLLANTVIGELALAIFDFGAIVGVIVFGVLLTIGRYLGVTGIENENITTGIIGSTISVITYGVFGSGILTQYSSDIYASAISVAMLVTLIIAILAALVVFSSSRSFEFTKSYSGISFIVGIGFAIVGTIFSPLLILAFGCFLIGFLLDLVYEIWALSDSQRRPLTNGLTLYIAFAGVFVHILQVVLEMQD